MEKRQLGRSGIEVSLLCLGTMTWGEQNTQEEGFAQMDAAVAAGINFFDTAEMYAVPPTAKSYGTTETIIGNWFRARPGLRQKLQQVGTAKRGASGSRAVVGPGDMQKHRAARARHHRIVIMSQHDHDVV